MYISVDDIPHQAVQLGRGALLVKLDIKSAYRLVPVHPSDRPLLGMAWHDEVYVDTRLPFGLRSAPKIFTVVANALEWGIRQCGVRFVGHYLDDFATFGPPDSLECQENVRTIIDTCTLLAPGAVVVGLVRVGFNSSGHSHWRRDISQSKS